jgi:two-component system sensor histidine kinase/response regulator
MTANAMQQDYDACMAAGMNDHIAKPIDPKDLFGKLLKWIKPVIKPQDNTKFKKPAASKAKGSTALPNIDGVDVNLGLSRVLGKLPRYISMLRSYVAHQEYASDEIRDALGARDYDTAERLAHTAKGLAGNIGATELQKLAAVLEKLIKDKFDEKAIESKLAIFADALLTVIEHIKVALLPEEHIPSSDVLDIEKARETLIKLVTLLINDESDAHDVLEENVDLLRYALGDELFVKVDQAIRSYDFEKAYKLLKTTEAQLNILLP